MPTPPKPTESVPSPNASADGPDAGRDPAPRTPPDIMLHAITGPPVPDMTDRIAESLRRHEAELANAERLVAQARGEAPPPPERVAEPSSPPAPGAHRVQIDWRGETAYYIEHDRRVTLACMYWGGPRGSVSHIDGMWEYEHGRRERLTPEERDAVLQQIIQYAKSHDNIPLAIEQG